MDWREDLIPARITSTPEAVSGEYRHEWIEQSPDNAGTYTTYAGCRFGTLSGADYATELNNHATASGTVVWIRRKSDIAGMPVYEFLQGGGGVDCVSPLYEQMASGTLAYCTGSGLLEETPILASGTVPTSQGSGRITFEVPIVRSGNINSGQIGNAHLSALSVLSGHLFSTTGVGANNRPIFGTAFGAGNISAASIAAAELASGIVSRHYLASGAVHSGHLANGAVVSGSYASGSIGRDHIASGTAPTADEGVTEMVVATYNLLSGAAQGTWAHSTASGSLPSVTLPRAGRYLVYATSRMIITPTAANTNVNASLRLLNSTGNILFSGSESIGLLNNTANRLDVTALIQFPITALSGITVQLQAKYDNAVPTIVQLGNDANGRTNLGYCRLGG